MRYNYNSGYGQALAAMVASRVPSFGRIFVVFDPDDTDEQNYQMAAEIFGPDPEGQIRFFGTNASDGTTPLEQAYAAMESNNNDVVLLDGNSTHLVSGLLNVTKSRCHFFGMDGGNRLVQQGAKIELSAVATDQTANIQVTGTRNAFHNLKIGNWGTHANSVASVIGHGDEGTLWDHCSFQKLSDLGVATVSDFECRSDSATFLDCEFGFSTLAISAARRSLWFKASGATRAKDCRFRDCRFVVQSSSSAYVFVEVNDTNSLAFSTIFERPVFYAANVASGADITDAVQSFSGLVEGEILLVDPHSIGCTNMCVSVADGVFISGPVSSGQGGEAIQAA